LKKYGGEKYGGNNVQQLAVSVETGIGFTEQVHLISQSETMSLPQWR